MASSRTSGRKGDRETSSAAPTEAPGPTPSYGGRLTGVSEVRTTAKLPGDWSSPAVASRRRYRHARRRSAPSPRRPCSGGRDRVGDYHDLATVLWLHEPFRHGLSGDPVNDGRELWGLSRRRISRSSSVLTFAKSSRPHETVRQLETCATPRSAPSQEHSVARCPDQQPLLLDGQEVQEQGCGVATRSTIPSTPERGHPSQPSRHRLMPRVLHPAATTRRHCRNRVHAGTAARTVAAPSAGIRAIPVIGGPISGFVCARTVNVHIAGFLALVIGSNHLQPIR